MSGVLPDDPNADPNGSTTGDVETNTDNSGLAGLDANGGGSTDPGDYLGGLIPGGGDSGGGMASGGENKSSTQTAPSQISNDPGAGGGGGAPPVPPPQPPKPPAPAPAPSKPFPWGVAAIVATLVAGLGLTFLTKRKG